MKDIFSEYKETANLSPITLKNKLTYYYDLDNIEQSFTGRLDALIANIFIAESVQLVINAISLLEKGYIDCAFYSLRQSLELSTVMIYLVELEPRKRKAELDRWKNQSKFPMFKEMIEYLNKYGDVFKEISTNMRHFFGEIKKAKEQLNLNVHKVGFDTFYVARKRVANKDYQRQIKKISEEFEYLLQKCIGAIAVLRLTIDPFPILLADEEIYARTGDLMTEPYSESFINRYIGQNEIESFKNTNYYRTYYNTLIKKEKMLPGVLDVVKNQYIDKNKIAEILSQSHLLGKSDFISVSICSCHENISNKIAKIYCYDGWEFYFTNTKTNRKNTDFDSRILREVKNSNQHVNFPYDEVFLTIVGNGEDPFFIEHNEPFSEEEYLEIKFIVDFALENLKSS